ncbi:hypothetical protein PL321_08550 [Caloramator sp. mosi_1]|nr:hypothetical protein [Caloramator sp. mosi_1]WDC85389.1 hypothetical protein PL321_08550 [Caloramator sp. mosi_1]
MLSPIDLEDNVRRLLISFIETLLYFSKISAIEAHIMAQAIDVPEADL